MVDWEPERVLAACGAQYRWDGRRANRARRQSSLPPVHLRNGRARAPNNLGLRTMFQAQFASLRSALANGSRGFGALPGKAAPQKFSKPHPDWGAVVQRVGWRQKVFKRSTRATSARFRKWGGGGLHQNRLGQPRRRDRTPRTESHNLAGIGRSASFFSTGVAATRSICVSGERCGFAFRDFGDSAWRTAVSARVCRTHMSGGTQ